MIQTNLLLVPLYIIYLIAVFTVGHFVAHHIFSLNNENSWKKLTFWFALGNIVYSLIFIFLGIFGLLSKGIITLIFIFPTLFLGLNLIKRKPLKIRGFLKVRIESFDTFFIVALAIVLLPLLVGLFMFPTSWDTLAYHLPLPKLFLKEGNLAFYGWLPESAYPIGIQSLFAFGESIGDIRIANFIVFSFLIFIVIYLLYGLRGEFSKLTLFLATSLFLFRPFFYSQIALTPFIDIPFALYGLIALDNFRSYLQNPDNLRKLLFVVFCVIFLALIKFTGLLFILSFAVSLLICAAFNKKKVREIISKKNFSLRKHRLSILGVLLVVIASLYWFGRNYFYTGNPVYPYFDNVFKSRYYSAEIYRSVTDTISEENSISRENLVTFIKQPFSYPHLTEIFSELMFLLFLFIGSLGVLIRGKKELKYYSLVGLLFFVSIWLIVGLHSRRYFLPILPPLALSTSSLVANWTRRKDNRKIASIVIIGVILCFQGLTFWNAAKVFFRNAFKLGLRSISSYQSARDVLKLQDNYIAIEYANNNLDSEKDKIMVISDNRLYYLEIPAIYGHPYLFFTKEDSNVEEVYWRMKDLDMTHFLENSNWGYATGFNADLYGAFRENYLDPIFSDKGLTLYNLK